ncbi:MAG: ATP-binding protein [Candidatus Margulisiibacteriota bacterium]
MDTIKRRLTDQLKADLARDKSILLLGPRQTGKTTLTQSLQSDLSLSFLLPSTRMRFEREPELLLKEIEALPASPKLPLVVLDEIQKVPDLLDVIQYIIDQNKAKFILTGSSARKLRRKASVNLLPGRVLYYKLDPLIIPENPIQDLTHHLTYGSLPGICLLENAAEKEKELDSYVSLYMEEEIRAEAVVRNIQAFSKFLMCAGSEAGQALNFAKLSQDIGVSQSTIASYYEILEDCLIIQRIMPLGGSSRRRLTKAPKYLLFDLGIRRLCTQEPAQLSEAALGGLFEQFIGLELLRFTHQSTQKTQLLYWRDHNGPEVDWILETNKTLIPIEVKWTSAPTEKDQRHLTTFMQEYNCKEGYIVCQTPRPFKLGPGITALPWQQLWQALG